MINVILVVETFIAFLVALTIHDWGHAIAGMVLGDDSLADDGMLSPNPVRHIAPIGAFVAAVLSFSYAGVGWGRPARVDSSRLRGGPDFGALLVALAGPLLNLLIGLGLVVGVTYVPGFGRLAAFVDSSNGPCPISTGLLVGQQLQQCLIHAQPGYVLRLEQFAIVLGVTNVLIALINILPLHPLDGYRVLYALVPSNPATRLRRWEPYMEAILLVLFFVVPLILAIAGINFSPASIFTNIANGIAAQVAGPAVILLALVL